jgi:hypothetical protein
MHMSADMESHSGWVFRAAEPKDAEAFAAWVAKNPLIEARDVEASAKKNQPTVLYFVAEKDGEPVAFAPVYLQLAVGHLAFNPEAEGRDKLEAMQRMVNGTVAFAVQFGIREIVTKSLPEYGVAKWALKHGFEMDDRNLFVFDINRILNRAAEEAKV